MQEWKDVLAQLGQRLGIAGLQADEQGYCALSIDPGWVLHLMYLPQRHCIQCMAELGALPVQGREAVLQHMLQANALFAGTDGATLGLDGARQLGVLSQELPLAGLDGVVLEQALECFVLQAERWGQWLQQQAQAADQAEAAADATSQAAGSAGQPGAAQAGAMSWHWG